MHFLSHAFLPKSSLCCQVAKCTCVYFLHIQRHARRAWHLSTGCVPRAAASCCSTLSPRAGGWAALGCDRGRVSPSHWALPVGGFSQSDNGGNPGREIWIGSPKTSSPWPVTLQLGKRSCAEWAFIYFPKAIRLTSAIVSCPSLTLLLPLPIHDPKKPVIHTVQVNIHSIYSTGDWHGLSLLSSLMAVGRTGLTTTQIEWLVTEGAFQC